MANRITKLLTRAATPGPVYKKTFTPSLGNLKQPYAGSGGGKGPIAGTRNLSYVAPGQPQRVDADNDYFAVQAYLGHTFVMRCVRTIADTIAALPFTAGPDPTDPSNYDPQAPLAQLLGPSTPQAPGGPNPTTSSRAFWAWTICQYIVTGRFAWEAQLDGGGKNAPLVALWPLVSQAISPIPTQGGTTMWDGFVFQTPTGELTIPTNKVIYGWRPSILDWRQPESVLQSAKLPIATAMALDKYQERLLRNNMVATTLVVTPPFDEPSGRRAWQEQFLQEFTGVERTGGTIFAEAEADEEDTQGKPYIQVERLAQSAVDAQLMEMMQQAKIDITIATGVPESLIGNASQRIFSNTEGEYKNFWTVTVLNQIMEFQDHINTLLAPRVGDEVGWFDLSKVAALSPPSIFSPPMIADVINLGVATAAQVANVLQIPAADATTDADTETVEQGEESSQIGAGGTSGGGGGRWLNAHELNIRAMQSPTMARWLDEAARRKRAPINSHTLQGLRKPWEPMEREHIVIRSVPFEPAAPPVLNRAAQPALAARTIKLANELRALATASKTTDDVHDKLSENYPESVLGWVDKADWSGPKDVPLDSIQMARRPGGRDQEKVQGIAKGIAAGSPGATAPVMLVKTPGSDKLKIADGYHRTLAHKRLGHDSVPAYVGEVDDDEGPWDKDMHEAKQNRQAELLANSIEATSYELRHFDGGDFDDWVRENGPALEALLADV